MKESVWNEYKMQFSARSENEGVARSMVCAIVSLLDPTLGELADVRCAVSEAVTNAIVHAYGDRGGSVYLTVKLLTGQTVQVEVTDKGCGISDVEKAMEPLFTSSPETERSGMGFSVMQTFMDEVTVRSRVGVGTTVTMRKRISGEDERR